MGRLTFILLGGFMSLVRAVNTIIPRIEAMSTPTPNRPQQFGAENSPLVSFSCLLSHELAHPAPRQENE
jgi:hypothetical protein